jgi:predicted N-acetyltransferase YhbS
MSCRFLFRPQIPDDLPTVEALHEEAFGPGRFARTAYRIRESSTLPPPIALTAWDSALLEHFPAKWKPVCVEKMRPNKELEPHFDSIEMEKALVGAIQFTAITIGGERGAMLLGPLAIAPAYKNMGCGLRLMKDGLAEAARLGFRLVVLVGDLPYYQRAGFRPIPPGKIARPGPADPARFLAAELEHGALLSFSGLAAADNTPSSLLAPLPALAEPG